MQKSLFGVLATVAVFAAGPARADGDNLGPDHVTVTFNGRVPDLCQIGGSSTTRDAFAMGTLINTATGQLRRDLRAPDRLLEDSWCNGPSQIEVSAVEMTPQSVVAQLREGFTNAVHFTATVSGWTENPAFYRTDGAAVQSSATQNAPQPRVTSLIVRVSDFRTRDGAQLRPVANRSYLGAVIVTLRPTP